MERKMINDQLEELYSQYYEDFIKELLALEKNKSVKCSNPLLMHCLENEYEKAKVKILFVGQETNKWYPDFNKGEYDIKKNIEFYKKFNLGIDPKNPQKNYYISPFWNFIRKINKYFNGESAKHTFLWTNINKIGKENDVGAPSSEFLDIEQKKFNVFAEEIRIVDPDVIIFLTGENKEYHISNKLTVTKPVISMCDDLFIQKLIIDNKDFENKLFIRTSHPHGMNHQAKFDLYAKSIIKIIEDNLIQ